MKRRDFLKGSGGFLASSFAAPAVAEELAVGPIAIAPCLSSRTKTRRNIYSLLAIDSNHPIIAAYRDGVREMKKRPKEDPTSWDFQSSIHANFCQHSGMSFVPITRYFLSWHRMYLYFFERIVWKASGNPEFALPYWDYGKPGEDALPPPFRVASFGGSPNSLFADRNSQINTGASLSDIMTLPEFFKHHSDLDASEELPIVEFDGYTGFQYLLETKVHNGIHPLIGGGMKDILTSASDPIFYLHHCNIDRLWEKWLSQGGRTSPIDLEWLTQHFDFYDEYKNPVSMVGFDVLYIASHLRYAYEDPPCLPFMLSSSLFDRTAWQSPQSKSRLLASFVIARNVRPQPGQMRLDLRLEDQEVRERLAKVLSLGTFTKSVDRGARYFVVFEGMQTEAPLDGYFEVFLGLPADGKPLSDRHYAGRLSFFGASAAFRRSRQSTHGGHLIGMQIHIDVTDTLQRLVERREISRDGLSVTLVPVGVRPAPDRPFIFHADAAPQIDTVVLTMERQS
jgi:tyrosinase